MAFKPSVWNPVGTFFNLLFLIAIELPLTILVAVIKAMTKEDKK